MLSGFFEQLRRLAGVLPFTNKILMSLSLKNKNADQTGIKLINLKFFIRIGKAAFLITQLINTTP